MTVYTVYTVNRPYALHNIHIDNTHTRKAVLASRGIWKLFPPSSYQHQCSARIVHSYLAFPHEGIDIKKSRQACFAIYLMQLDT